MRAQFRLRIRLILLGVLLAAIAITVRLYFVQIVHGEEYASKADRQFAAGGGTLFDRGSIFFTRRDGTLISAASLSTGFLVAINPQTLADPDLAYAAIAEVASSSVSREAFMAAAKKKNQVYIEVAHRLPDSLGKALAAKAIPGVSVLRERWRTYPGNALATQSVGIVSYGTGDTLAGQTGLELQYDSTLARSGASLYQNFFAEIFSNVGNLVVDAKDAKEGSLVTTIEPNVQTRLIDDLLHVTKQYSSRESGGIIMDPKTGAIIALATVPTYDPNNLQDATPELLTNPLVEHVYEFGSIMKPLTMAAGLDAGVITPASTYNDTGCITVDTYKVCNWDLKAHGTTNMQTVLSKSLNVGASWIATKLGQDRFRSYFMALFGQKTAVDLPFETGALLSNLHKPQQVSYDTASFGQGIAVTPLQMIRAEGALANGGVMVEPHLVSAIKLDSGVTRELVWDDQKRVFSAEAAREVTTMLTEVNDTALGNGKYKIPTMSVAVKTGTAQLVKPGGGYYTDRFFHSFLGYFPSYSPRFIVLLYTHDPKGVQFSSETLTETYEDLVHFLIDYYAVPPDRGVATTTL